jgi:TolA-binding protein
MSHFMSLQKKSYFNKIVAGVVAGAVTLALSGCLVTRQQIRDSQKSGALTPDQQNKTENEVRYQDLEEMLRVTSGKVETLENTVNMLNAEKTGAALEYQNEKKSFEEKLKIFEEAITKLEAQNMSLQRRIDELQSSMAAGAAAPKTVAKDAGAAGGANKSIFETAEQNFSNKKWKEAIVSYEKYRSTYPTGRKYAEATYKIGVAFHELGMRTEAKVFYAEVTEKFSKSEWAKKSQQRLKILK